jgi:hypothetical protein
MFFSDDQPNACTNVGRFLYLGMINTIRQLEGIIARYYPLLKNIPATEMDTKFDVAKWSKKEQLGHLIDSAQNNIRRFIEAQYQQQPPVIVYNQDEWVIRNRYQQQPSEMILELWRLLNLQVCHILGNMSPDNYENICIRREPHTIQWLADDYNKHLLYHLHRILELEPVPYP